MGEWGRVDILVNNAGILRDKSFAKMELDDFRLVLDVHLMGAVHCTKAVWEVMREQKYGRIVMTTSSTGLYGNFGQSNYGAAKMALVGLMQTLALEGAKYDIRVNCLAPTAATRMTAGLMPEAVLKQLEPGLGDAGLARARRRGRADARDPLRRRRRLRAGPRHPDAGHPRRHWATTPPSRSPAAGTRSPIATARPCPRAARRKARSRSARRCAPPAEPAARGSAQPSRSAPVEPLDQVRGAQRAGLCRLGRGAMLDDAERGGVERRRRRAPATADPAGEHVAGARGGERGVAGGADPRRARPGAAMTLPEPLSTTVAR